MPTPLMTIPGHTDPVPLPREVTARADGRIDLLGLSRGSVTQLFAETMSALA